MTSQKYAFSLVYTLRSVFVSEPPWLVNVLRFGFVSNKSPVMLFTRTNQSGSATDLTQGCSPVKAPMGLLHRSALEQPTITTA